MTKLERILIVVCALLVGSLLFYAHRKAVDNAATAATRDAEKKAAMTAISDIQNASKAKDAVYQKQIADLAAQKQQVITVREIIHDLPKQVTLPDNGSSLTEVTEKQAEAVNAAVPDAPNPIHAGDLCMSKPDAKALYDAANDGNQCKLALAKSNDDFAALTKIDAVKDTEIKQQDVLLKGGTTWTRFKRGSKWTAVGILIGAGATAYFTHR